MKIKKPIFSLVSSILILSIFVLVTLLGFRLNSITSNKVKAANTSTFERGIARRSSPRFVSTPNSDYLNYDYVFIDSAYQIQNESARKKLLNLNCVYKNINVYQPTSPISTLKIDNPDAPKDEQTSSYVFTPGKPKLVSKAGYVCHNSLMRFESFSKYFDSGHYLYSLMKMYEDGNAALLPVFDSLNSTRFHSSDRNTQDDVTKMSELFYTEALNASLSSATNTSANKQFTLWGRWAESILSKDIIEQSDDGNKETRKVKKFSINRWLNVFSDYFLRTNGVGCNEVWGTFDSTNYYWDTVLAHENYHHYFSAILRNESNETNLPIDYQYYKLKRDSSSNSFISTIKNEKMVPSVYNRLAKYFSEIKRDFWDNDPAKKFQSKIDLSNTIGASKISYFVAPSKLAYIYEPEEILVRLFSLLTFYRKGLNPAILETTTSSGYDICAPSFFLQDYMAFKNKMYSINPFEASNFYKALAIILEAVEFNQPIARITKMSKTKPGISFQGWSRPNTYQKLVFEEINPLAGINATKRNIIDLSWSASNFFVRQKFNDQKKKYVKCSSDYDNVQLVDDWASSCQMWTTPLIDPNELFDKFFTKTTEVNSNIADNGDVYVGFQVYFWNDINNDGEIQINEKIFPNINIQNLINARQMSIKPDNVCKISIVKNKGRVELWRYVGKEYQDQLQNIDALCKESWS